jgi:putative ABC transport system permease protein
LPRFPPRPLIYTSYLNAARILPREQHLLTFVLVTAKSGVSSQQLARRIENQTGLRARTSDEFKSDTVRWYLVNSEDVGDMSAMIILAMTVGFGTTGIMLYMFTYENLKQYAVLKAMGATHRTLQVMILVQASVCALIGTGLGLGICGIAGALVAPIGFPFRLMWFAPVIGAVGVLVVSLTAAAISIRPVLRLEPGVVFAGR